MFKHVLVAVDGSAQADKALTLALELPDDPKVTALIAVPDYGVVQFAEATFSRDTDIAGLRTKLADEGRRQLDAALDHHGSRAARIERLAVVSDMPYQQIVDTAKRLHCDLIVMGSRGRGALAALLLGSQTQRVLALAEVPVLVTP